MKSSRLNPTLSNLFAAIERGKEGEVVIILGGDLNLINAQDQNGATALHIAADKGYQGVVDLLLTYGPDLKATDFRRKRTALDVAYAAKSRAQREGKKEEFAKYSNIIQAIESKIKN